MALPLLRAAPHVPELDALLPQEVKLGANCVCVVMPSSLSSSSEARHTTWLRPVECRSASTTSVEYLCVGKGQCCEGGLLWVPWVELL